MPSTKNPSHERPQVRIAVLGLDLAKYDVHLVGMDATRDRVSHHDLHATILHLLGLNHERLAFRQNSRDFRLTDVYGDVVHELIA